MAVLWLFYHIFYMYSPFTLYILNSQWNFNIFISINIWCLISVGPSWSYGSWIYNYQCLSPLILWVWTPLRWVVLDTSLCNKVCQWLAAGLWFSTGTPVFSTNKTDCHDITEILLKVALNTIKPNLICV